MANLIMWNIITVDGYFEGEKSWDLPWHEQIWGEELKQFSIEQLQSAEALLFGRVTYEGMAAHWTTAEGETADYMNRLPKIVCSRTLRSADWNNTTLIKDGATGVSELKQQKSGNIFVFGSANLSATLIEENLFDEYRLAIAPFLHGKGRFLFHSGLTERRLKLLEARQFSNGSVMLRYANSADGNG